MNISISKKRISLPWFPGSHFLRGLITKSKALSIFDSPDSPDMSSYKIQIYQIKTIAHRHAAQSRRCLRNDDRTVLLPVLEAELRDSGTISIDQ